MKIVIAPDSFKENLTALEVANYIEIGVKRVFPKAKIHKVPLADGGEGTVQSLVDATSGKIYECAVTSPLEKKIKAFYGILGDKKTAVVEMASASGLSLVPLSKRNPMLTTTYGTGELIKASLKHNPQKLIIGIGGSATVDGGAGMAQALGIELLNKKGLPLKLGGEGLKDLDKIDVSKMDKRIKDLEVLVASDVDNPLTGSKGAAYVYGPQKGATREMVKKLDRYLAHYAKIIKRDLKYSVENIPGAGAAGGLGAGLIAFLNAQLRLGIDIICEIVAVEKYLKNADLLITGEGKIDFQTVSGKTPVGVAKIAKKYGVPVIGIGGSVTENGFLVYEYGVDALISTVKSPMKLEEAIKKAPQLITEAAEGIMRAVRIGYTLTF